MKAVLGGFIVTAGIHGALAKCKPKPGQEPFAAYCELANCEIYTAFCEPTDGTGGPPTGKCRPKSGMEAYWEFCLRDDCNTAFEAFCELSDGSGPAPTTSTTTTTTKSTTTTTKAQAPSVDCKRIAENHPFGSMLEDLCAEQIVEHICKKQTDCNDASCVEDRLRQFYEALGLTYVPGPTNPPPPPAETTEDSGSGNPPSDGEVPFEKNISPADIVTASPWGITNYNGKNGFEAATMIHQQITEAIRNGPPEFKKFCGTGNLEADRREAAAFFANVAKETGGLGDFEEGTGATYCTHLGDGDSGLQAAGKDFPCCVQEDKTTVCTDQANCPYGCQMHGRGAIQLTWNFNYGRFSEFYYGDKDVLLRNPGQVEPRGATGWAASLWFWMTTQDYGGACPPPHDFSWELPMGHQSCHQAMHDPQGGGFGQTIRIINGGYEACPFTGVQNGALRRVEYYFNMCSHMKVPAAPGCALDDPACDVSGIEFYDATDGKIGNPQLGRPTSQECPSCKIPDCTATTAQKYGICMTTPDHPTCPEPLPAMTSFRCQNL